MKWQADQAYNHLPPLPLDNERGELAKTLPLLKACIRKMVVTLNSMLRDGVMWEAPKA
ncbi:hypothetical protein L2737_06250 [Shewanella electrodiphila]|uniref:Transposase n=1 Tax=Shewanella electrodiphila TaxID=934143 RepID=A0ABT0KMD5_9GAMM|nr:hypothetical protein [Shewanella electrodiphila]MCL1044929.1 hypothetical protein [Shewanella electrodiphila]